MNVRFRRRIGLLFLAAAALQMAEPRAEDTSAHAVAHVDGAAITVADVDREIALAFPNRTIDSRAQAALRSQTTEQLIRRQLVLRYLRGTQQSASPADVDLAIDRLKKQLAQREESLDDYLQARQLDESGLRRSLAWQIGWGRLLEKYLSDTNLQRYFEKHRRDFDGTELRVAHILFPVDEGADSAARLAARNKANEILAQIRAEQLTFSEAAKRYSSGASRDAGGDIGLISRREPMPEAFSRAAFALEVNQVSEPVETTFGFHLIRCLEIKPGQQRWSDVRKELEQAVTEYLFNWAADQARPNAKIELTP